MTDIRKHRGGLAESLKTKFSVAGRKELLAAVRAEFGDGISDSDLKISPYVRDDRTGWDTHIITLEGRGVYGFSNGPVAP